MTAFPRIAWAAALASALLPAGAGAQTCPIPVVDLAASLKALPRVLAVSTSRRRDGDSNEPVLRHLVDYDDGATVVVEQQNCRMRNLRLTLLSPSEAPRAADLQRAGRVLAATPVWKRFFGRYDAVAALAREPQSAEWKGKAASGRFSYPLGGRLSASGERSEAIVSFMRTDEYAAQYRSVFALYIGVGGS